jgi:predicted protein tyrosine phosphatase
MKSKKNILFVCTANELRSPTAEELFKNDKTLNVKSAGTHIYANRQIDKDLVKWSELIIVMQEHHKKKIIKKFPSAEKKIVVLNIPDKYARNDPELIKILKKKVPPHLNKLMETNN